MNPVLERRGFVADLKKRGRRLEGYAAVFNTPADIGGEYTEVIIPGAFGLTLRQKTDILALVDHDPGKVLARTRSGSLRLSEDAQGLSFDLDIPDTGTGHDILALAERGDLGGMSFGFHAKEQHRTGSRRELRVVDLVEISVVQSWPAYVGTTVQARAMQGRAPLRAAVDRSLRIWRFMS